MASQITAWDYVVLSIILLISIFIGVYHGFSQTIASLILKIKAKLKPKNEVSAESKNIELNEIENKTNINNETEENQNNKTSEFIMANSTMRTLPIAFSLLASFYSATSLLGIPAEIYQYGIQYWMIAFSQAACPLLGAFITGPFFAKLKVLSIFEYFEMRFDSRNVKLIGMGCYLVRNSISCSIFMYGPATSLALLANIDEMVCIGLIGFIGTFYTAIGGIKGVIWNDLFQALVMFTSLTIIVTKGVIDAGGFSMLWETNSNGGRLNFFDFNPDPFIRQSFWSLIFGQVIYMSMSYCFDQQMIQRFQASKTKRIAQKALILNSPGVFLMVSLCCFVGLCVYANFSGCDPLTHPDPSQRIGNPNQLVGYFVLNNLKDYPGVAGLFLASIFCGSLSSVSSYINSQAAIIWTDFLRLFQHFRDFDDAKSLRTNKILVLICGLIGTGLAFFISTVGGNLTQISTSLNGAFNAPIMGLFLLGMLFSITTPLGVIVGTVAGFLAGLWLSIGSSIVKPVYPKLNVTTEFCPNATDFPPFFNSNKTVLMASELTGFDKIYSLSYMWLMPFGILVTIVVGLFASVFDGGLKYKLKNKHDYIYFDLSWFCIRHKVDKKVEDNGEDKIGINEIE